MRFNELTEQDKGIICEKYLTTGRRDAADAALSEMFDVSERTIRNWARELRLTGENRDTREIEIDLKTPFDNTPLEKDTAYYLGLLNERELLFPKTETNYRPIFFEEGKDRVLVIGDLHTPFDLTEYLDHCKKVYDMFNCNRVVFIGDVIDNHYASFHGTDPDGMGGGDELDYAIARVQRYYQVFPKAKVLIGNHDRIVARKAFAGGIPKQWIKSYEEVLQVPGWEFVHEVEIDGVLYFHGEAGTASTKMKNELQSTAQGHLHTQAYIIWAFSKISRIFGLQVGTGIDFDKYAFAYAKAGKKPAISCGVVLNGKYPFLLPMDL